MTTDIQVCTLDEVSRNIRAYRGDKSQKDVAEAAQVSQANLSRWESAISEPGCISLAQLALAIDCTPNDLVLRSKVSDMFSSLPEELFTRLLRIIEHSLWMHRHNKPGTMDPIVALEELLRSVRYGDKAPAMPVPAGTTISTEKNVKLYTLPDRRKAESIHVGKAQEHSPECGKNKRKK